MNNQKIQYCYTELLHLIQQNQTKDYNSINSIVQNWIQTNPNIVNADLATIETIQNILLSLFINYQLDYNKILLDVRKRLSEGTLDINTFINERLSFYFNSDAVNMLYQSLDFDSTFQTVDDLLNGLLKTIIAQYIDASIANILKTPLSPEQQLKIYNLWKQGDLTSDSLYSILKDNVYDPIKLVYLSKPLNTSLQLINRQQLDTFKQALLDKKATQELVSNSTSAYSKILSNQIVDFDGIKDELHLDDYVSKYNDLSNQLNVLQDQLNSGEISQEEFDSKYSKISSELQVISKALINVTNTVTNLKQVSDLFNQIGDEKINKLINLFKISQNIPTDNIYRISILLLEVNSATSIDDINAYTIDELVEYLKTVKLDDDPILVRDEIINIINSTLKKTLSHIASKELLKRLDDYFEKEKKIYNTKSAAIISYIKSQGISLNSLKVSKIVHLLDDELFNVSDILPENLKNLAQKIAQIAGSSSLKEKLPDQIIKVYDIKVIVPKTTTDPITLKSMFNENVLKNFLKDPSSVGANANALLLLAAVYLGFNSKSALNLEKLAQAVNFSEALNTMGITANKIKELITQLKLSTTTYFTLKTLADLTNNNGLFEDIKNVETLDKQSIGSSDFLLSTAINNSNVEITEDDVDSVTQQASNVFNSTTQGMPGKIVSNDEYYDLISKSAQWKTLVKKFPTYGIPDDVLNSDKAKYVFKIKKSPNSPLITGIGPVSMYIDKQLIKVIAKPGETIQQIADKLNDKYSEEFSSTNVPIYTTDDLFIVLSDPVDINPQLVEYVPNTIDKTAMETLSAIGEFTPDVNNPQLIYPGDLKIKKYAIKIPQSDNFVEGDSATAGYIIGPNAYSFKYYPDSTVEQFINDIIKVFGDIIIKKTSTQYIIATPQSVEIDYDSNFKAGEVGFKELPPAYNKPTTIPSTFKSSDTVDSDNVVETTKTITTTIDGVPVDTVIPAGTKYSDALKLIEQNLQQNEVNITIDINSDGTLSVASTDQNSNIEFSDIAPPVELQPVTNDQILSTDSAKEYSKDAPVSDKTDLSSFAQYTGSTLVDPSLYPAPDAQFPQIDPEVSNKLSDFIDSISSLSPSQQAEKIKDKLQQIDTTPDNPFTAASYVDSGPQTVNKDDNKSRIDKAKDKWKNFVRELEHSSAAKTAGNIADALLNPPVVDKKALDSSNITTPSDRDMLNIVGAGLQGMGVLNKPLPPKGDFDMTNYLAPGYVPPTSLDKYKALADLAYKAVHEMSPQQFKDMINSKLPPWVRADLDKNGNLILKAGYGVDLTKIPAYKRLNQIMNLNLNKVAQAYIDDQLLLFNQILQGMLLDFMGQIMQNLKPFFDLFKSLNSVLDAALAGARKPNSRFCNWGFSLPGFGLSLSLALKYFPFKMPTLDLDALLASIIKALKTAVSNFINMLKGALKYVWVMVKLMIKTAKDLIAKAFKAIAKSKGMITCDITATIANVLNIIIAAIRIITAISKFLSKLKPPKLTVNAGQLASKIKQAKNRAKNKV